MPVSTFTFFAFITLAALSTLFAKLQTMVNVIDDSFNIPHLTRYSDPHNDQLYPDHQFRHIMWFLQISDTHLSKFHDPGRQSDLRKFCSEVVPIVKPSVVVASGDLVDSTMANNIGSRQHIEEWQMYQQILNETAVTKVTVWLDIRGNHDNFNTFSLDDNDTFYRHFSVQGPKHGKSYRFRIQNGSEQYTFIGIDACMSPGPKRPFNFMGIIAEDEYDILLNFLNESRNDNMTIWFGHFPTSTIVSPRPGVRELMRNSGPYLCGHLHTAGGLIPQMYTLQNTGSLELELADWKETRKFRLAAVDYGMFSFVDVTLNDWPIILVTNPKDAMFTMPKVEPFYRTSNSTHIRVLVFSTHLIVDVQLKIDNGLWIKLKNVHGPLYVLPWTPDDYSMGLHHLEVFAQDQKGNEKIVYHQFALDGTRPTFPFWGRFILMTHISVGQGIFAFMLLLIVLPLCILRACHFLHYDYTIISKSETNCLWRFTFKLLLLSSVSTLFWPIILGALYVALGPWFVGYIIDGHIGVCFVWGIIIAGHFIPGGLTYAMGFVYLFAFYLPFTLCLSHFLYLHCRNVMEGRVIDYSLPWLICRHSCMLAFLSLEIAVSVVVYFFSYGTMAFILGFLHLWSVLAAILLWRIAVTLPEAKVTGLHIWDRRQTVETPLLPSRSNQAPSGSCQPGINPVDL